MGRGLKSGRIKEILVSLICVWLEGKKNGRIKRRNYTLPP